MLAKQLKRKLVAAASVLGMAKEGVFVPHCHAAALDPDEGYPELAALFDVARPGMRSVLAAIDGHGDIVARFENARPPVPRWQQDWFPALDGAAAYTLVRAHRPARILEIGSGHSTRFLMQAIRDGGFACAVTCIDPAPRADLAGLEVELIRRPLQQVAPAALPDLAAGDVLFIDSSHLALPGSDVDRVFSRLLPGLPAGVLVHIHDVFLPDPYPPAWAWRAYSEQLVVAAWLASGGLEPLFASHYVRTRMAGEFAASAVGRLPLSATAIESSLWAVKRAAAR